MDSPEPKRSIQDIIPPARSRPIRPTTPPPISITDTPSETPPPPPPPAPPRPTPPEPMELQPEPRRSLMKFITIAAIALVVVAGGIAVASTFFHRAYVTLTPQRFETTVQGSFEAAPGSPTLSYKKVSVEDTLSKTVPATGNKEVSERASGTVTIYNAFSTGPQKLITNTRFATPEGLEYRVHAPVSVPGYTMKAGLKVPGSVEVTIYADAPGEKYNVGLTEFTVPGLKSTPEQYKLITARSKTAMEGGFVGQRAIVDPAVRSLSVQELKAELERVLRGKITGSAPAGTLIFEETVRVTFTEGPDKFASGSAAISLSGSAVAPAFDAGMFAQSIARSGGVAYQGPLMLENPADIAVQLGDKGSAVSEDPLSISVSGPARLAPIFDIAQLAMDLAGKSKSDVAAIQAGYPGAESINVKAYPFWLSSLPSDPEKIQVEIAGGVDQTP